MVKTLTKTFFIRFNCMGVPTYVFKVCIAGEGGCGKTTLLHRWVEGVFLPDTKMTIGSSFMVKTVQYGDITMNLQIWDLGGEVRFRTFLPAFVKGARLTLLVFDITRYATFTRLPEWIRLIREEGGCENIILVGTKIDLIERRQVSAEEAFNFAQEQGLLGYAEVSSKTGQNVDELFNRVVEFLAESVMGESG